MLEFRTMKRAWGLLDQSMRREAKIVLVAALAGALSSTVLIGSILPFLTVLANPEQIQEHAYLSAAYEAGGFTSNFEFLSWIGYGTIAVILLAYSIEFLRIFAMARFNAIMTKYLSTRLLSRYAQQPYVFFLSEHSGDMSTKVLSEVGQAIGQFFKPVLDIMAGTLTTIAIVGFLMVFHPTITATVFLLFGGLYALTYFFSRQFLTRLGQRRLQANKNRFRTASELLGGIKAIKLLGRETTYLDRFLVNSATLAKVGVNVTLLTTSPRIIMQVFAFSGLVVFCLVLLKPSSFETGQGLAEIVPVLGVFALAGQRLIPELSKLYAGISSLRYAGAAIDTLADDFERTAGAMAIPRQPAAHLGLRRSLTLEGVSFRYPMAERVGLRDVSLSIQAGEKIGIVGMTGAGKTTLADLLLGLLRPTEGTLVVDGKTVTEEMLRSWQQSVGYVPQDIFLVDDSVRANVALGVPPDEIEEERLISSARIAQLHDFVTEQLPQGYDTVLGERGVRLSGGQRQRVGIARALYQNADLIVFDEATSALDNLTEREVITAIEALPGDKTVVMIAHRLTTLRGCDRIIVLDAGAVVGFDTWERLQHGNDAFRTIAEAQIALKSAAG